MHCLTHEHCWSATFQPAPHASRTVPVLAIRCHSLGSPDSSLPCQGQLLSFIPKPVLHTTLPTISMFSGLISTCAGCHGAQKTSSLCWTEYHPHSTSICRPAFERLTCCELGNLVCLISQPLNAFLPALWHCTHANSCLLNFHVCWYADYCAQQPGDTGDAAQLCPADIKTHVGVCPDMGGGYGCGPKGEVNNSLNLVLSRLPS